ncbi:hypothetical protein [Streptomyces lavendofoliae]|uniref:hypothetical protein n=1 Tax=Streptomyces lavendofoliae TaxID=67314 RepID=UPI003D93CC2E
MTISRDIAPPAGSPAPPAPGGRTRRASRGRRGVALAALCALALAACGTERAGDRGAEAGRAAAGPASASPAAASPAAASPAPSDGATADDAEPLAFMELLLKVAEPCVGDLPVPPTGPEPEGGPGTGPVPPEPQPAPGHQGPAAEGPLPVPDEPPVPSAPRDPEAAKQERELSSVEECEARLHARRITRALKDTAGPSPRQVREVLGGLGYLDERILGLRSAGGGVEFTLDLRLMDGQLCLSGSTTGAKTVIDPYGASTGVGCPDVRRRR